jgi:inhibitor of cysteine peptidase
MEETADTISVMRGENFTVRLEAVPTAGYRWQPIYDEAYVKLISNDFVPSSKKMGAGGVEQYLFNALKPGKTVIEMVYKRPWEKNILKSMKFYVNIE